MTETQTQQAYPNELQLPRDSRSNAIQRRDPMVRIRIKSRTTNQVIPGGYILPEGESVCLVYTPDLPAIKAMVETQPELIQLAREALDRAIMHDLKEELADISDPEGRAQHMARRRQEYSGSIEGMFFFLYKRDIKPFESVEVLEENIPAPVQVQQVEQQTFLASTIAREVAAALAAVLPTIISAVVNGGAPQQPQSKQR